MDDRNPRSKFVCRNFTLRFYGLLFLQGSRVWLLEGKNWVPAVVTEAKSGQITFRTEYDKVSS